MICVCIVLTWSKAGIPLSKIDCLRSFLEKYGHRLTSQSHLRELIPSVLQKEKETLKSELSEAKAVSTIFDGSTRLGEALAIIVRFVDSQWNVQQRLVRLQVSAKSLKAEEPAQWLIQALAVEYAIQPGALLAAMKDGASGNQAALLMLPASRIKLITWASTLSSVSLIHLHNIGWACSRTVLLHALRGRPGLELLCGPTVRPDGGANGRWWI